MTRTHTLMLALILALVLVIGGCGGSSDSASPDFDSDDDDGPIITDDDVSDDDDDDDDNDDDAAPDGRVTIVYPEEGEVILGYQVPVEIHFAADGDSFLQPDTYMLTLDGVNVTDELAYSPANGRAWADLQDVQEGGHELHFVADFSDGSSEDSVSFATTLEGSPRIEMSLSGNLVPAGGQISAEVHVYDAFNNDVSNSVTVELEVFPTNGVTVQGMNITFNQTGDYTVTASTVYQQQELSDSDEVVVFDGSEISRVEIECSPGEIDAGGEVECEHTIYDEDNNVMQGTVYYTTDPEEGATINGGTLLLTLATSYTVTGTVAGTDVSDNAQVLVNAGPADDVSLTIDPDHIEVEETVTAEASVVDAYGNPVAGDVELEANPPDGIVINGMQITANKARLLPYIIHAWALEHTVHDQHELHVTETSLPHVEITSPERGQFIQTASINLQGTATDEHSDIDRILVNGTEIYFNPDTGQFSQGVSLEPGLNNIIVEAFDVFENSDKANISAMYAGTILNNGDPAENAIAARINQSGLDKIETIAEELVEDYRSEIMGYIPDPLFHETVDLLIVEVDATATVDSVDYDPVNIELISQNGGIRLEATATNLDIAGNLSVDLDWFDKGKEFIDLDFDVLADAVGLTGDVAVSVNTDGTLAVTLTNVDVIINGFFVDLESGLLEDIVEWILEQFDDIVIDEVKSMLEDMIYDTIPPLLDELLNELDLSFDFEILDFTYGFTADFNETAFSSEGGELWLNTIAWYGDGTWTQPGPNTPDLPGSIRTITLPPELGVYIPGTSTPYEFGAVISDDMLNQLLHAVHRSGLLSLNLDQETLEALGIDDFELNTTYLMLFMPGIVQAFGLNKTVELRLRPLLPPVFLMTASDSFNAEIQMGDFVLEWWCEEEPDVWTLFAKVALALYVPTAVDVDSETQTITVDFGDIEMYADLYEEPVFDIGNAFFEDLLPGLVQLLVPALLEGLLEEIPIPSFEGFTLEVEAFQPIGAAGDWAGLFGNLIQVPSLLEYYMWDLQQQFPYQAL